MGLRLVILLLATLTGVVAGSASGGVAVAFDPGTGKYYVVGPPVNGQREYLYQIAAATLGDGNRYQEIFELNRGRRQADGGALTDPTALRPGWVLELPADAKGPQVRTGTMPLPAGSPAPSPAPAGDAGGSGGWLIAGGGLVAMLLALAGYLAVRRSRGRSGRHTPVIEASPKSLLLLEGRPDHGVAGTAAAAIDGPAGPAPPCPAPTSPAPTLPVPPPPRRLAITGDRLLAEVDGPAGRLSVRLSGVPAGGVVRPFAWLAEGERWPVDGRWPPDGRWPVDGRWPADGRWPVDDERRATLGLPVEIGQSGGWRLWIDLAGTPGVFTLTGPAEASRRQAHAIGARLSADGHVVAVVGSVLGSPPPDGWLSLPAFPASAADLPAGTGVVISGGLRGADLASARRLGARSGNRLVPIIVGTVLRARWSATASLHTQEATR